MDPIRVNWCVRFVHHAPISQPAPPAIICNNNIHKSVVVVSAVDGTRYSIPAATERAAACSLSHSLARYPILVYANLTWRNWFRSLWKANKLRQHADDQHKSVTRGVIRRISLSLSFDHSMHLLTLTSSILTDWNAFTNAPRRNNQIDCLRHHPANELSTRIESKSGAVNHWIWKMPAERNQQIIRHKLTINRWNGVRVFACETINPDRLMPFERWITGSGTDTGKCPGSLFWGAQSQKSRTKNIYKMHYYWHMLRSAHSTQNDHWSPIVDHLMSTIVPWITHTHEIARKKKKFNCKF